MCVLIMENRWLGWYWWWLLEVDQVFWKKLAEVPPVGLEMYCICKSPSAESPPAGTLKKLLHKHDSLFEDELGTVTSHKATLRVRPDATPRFFKPRPVPYATKEVIGDELDRMEQQGIIQKVPSSDALVAVPKLRRL